MKIYEKNNSIIIEGMEHFTATHTLDCGQCFRWEQEEDGSYTGIAYEKVINIKTHHNTVTINNTNMNDFNEIWRSYFDFDRNYGDIKYILCKDEVMKEAVAFGSGIRILQQDPWECLVSFIISSNNIIPRIKKIIKSLSEMYGQPITWKGKVYHTFPRPEDLYGRSLEELAFCRSGYRCKYILDAARAVVEQEVKLDHLKNIDCAQARKELMRIKGVGPKVADCILLFSLQKYDVFPTDVWIKRIVQNLYFDNTVTIQDVQKFANKNYAQLGGFAQQYLFYYARELKIGR